MPATEGARAGDGPPTRHERANLWVICAAQFLTLAGMTSVVPLFPLYLGTIGVVDPVELRYWTGLLGSAPFFVAVFATPIWGALGDRFGHKPMVVRSLTGIAVVTIGMGLSHSAWALLGWRTLQGAISGVFPAAVALLTALTPSLRVSAALARLQSARAAGVLCGPLLGGILADFFGIRTLFFAVGSIGLAMAALSIAVINEPSRNGDGDDAVGSPALYGWRQMLSPATIPMLALLCAQQAATMCSWPSLALFVTELGVPPASVGTVTGLVVFAQSLPVIFIAARWTAYGKRLGGNNALALALCANGTVAVLIGAVAWRIEIVIALRLLSGTAIAGFIPLVFDRISSSVPPQARGRIAGLASTAMMTGSLLGPITGAWLAVHLGIGATFWVPGLMLFAIGTVLAMKRKD